MSAVMKRQGDKFEWQAPKARGDRVYTARRFDCGPMGLLTAKEAAMASGLNETTIRLRIRDGVTGASILAPKKRPGGPKSEAIYRDQPGMRTIELAVRLARRFAKKAPTARQLMSDYRMSRATAYRWVEYLAVTP